MGFLQPILLALGVAAAVPILLHLLQRFQGTRVVFPALRYLRRAEREHARRIRIRQLLLMLLRVAAIALLAAAAARPFLRAGGGSHAPTAVVIVLDNSMSTGVVSGDRRVIDDLKARALETLERSDAQDRFWLVRAGSPWEPAWPGDAEETAERVRETMATGAAADLASAVERARAVLEAGAEGRAPEIHLLTDLQETGLSGGVPGPGEPVPLLIWAPDDAPPRNQSVSEVEIGGGAIPPAGLRTTAAVRVSGDTGSAVTVRLAIEGRVVGAATPASGSAALLALPGLPQGPVWGYAETDPDALRADDRRYFALRVPEAPGVGATAGLGLAESAIDVLAGSGRIRRSGPGEADAVVAPGLAGASTIPAAATVIVLPPASEAELPGLNRRLAEAGVPWRYEAGPDSGDTRFAVDASDPLEAQLAAVRIHRAFRLAPTDDRPASADSALLRLADGTPWAVRGPRRGGGRFILLASTFAEDASTLPASAALVPLLDRLLGAWSFSARAPAGAEPGAEIAVPAGVSEVERPDGVVEPVELGTAYRLGPDPGVYRFRADGRVVETLAANPPARESDLRRADRSRIAEAFRGYRVTTARGDGWTGIIYRSRLGSDVWRPVALAAVLVLLLESVAAAAGTRAGARVTAVPAPAGDGTPAAT
jgi:hypothetical protein